MDNKNIILIDGKNSKWYEHAIFIINENEKNIPKNIVLEAEKIIAKHINEKYLKKDKKQKIKYNKNLFKALGICIIFSLLLFLLHNINCF